MELKWCSENRNVYKAPEDPVGGGKPLVDAGVIYISPKHSSTQNTKKN